MTKIEKTLIKKDLVEILQNERVFLPMVALPILMTILIPLVLVLGAKYLLTDEMIMNQLRLLLKNLPTEYSNYSSGQLMTRIMINYMFPAYFLIIPIMSSSVIGASSFVGEKEHKTMETLLYTPISVKQLFRAKILGVFIASYGITLVAFIGFSIVMNIGGLIYFGNLIFPNEKWLIIIFWISPAISTLSITVTAMISATSKSFQEAQQLSGLLVIPVFFGLAGQMSGATMPNNTIMIIIGVFIFIIDYLLIKKSSSKFVVEKLIK